MPLGASKPGETPSQRYSCMPLMPLINISIQKKRLPTASTHAKHIRGTKEGGWVLAGSLSWAWSAHFSALFGKITDTQEHHSRTISLEELGANEIVD